MGRGGLFHCIGNNMEDQRTCVVSLLPPQQKQLDNQTLKKSQGSNACHFVFLMGPRISTALDLVIVLVLSSWSQHWTPLVTWWRGHVT